MIVKMMQTISGRNCDSILILSLENLTNGGILNVTMLKVWNDLEMLQFVYHSRLIMCIVGGIADINVVQHFMKMCL